MENKEKVVAAFKEAGKALKSSEVATLAQIEKKDADKIIKTLVADGVLVSPKRCFYELK